MKNRKHQGSSGFSLTEILVVVAVIGILSSIAYPGYIKFRARAIQAAGKKELTDGFVFEQAFYAAYHTFHGNLCYIGFRPVNITMTAGTASVAPGYKRYYGYSSGGGTGPALGRADVNVAISQKAGEAECFGAAFSGTCYPTNMPGGNGWCAETPGGPGDPACHTQPQTFMHQIWGSISPSKTWDVGQKGDSWKIDQDRKLYQVRDGL